jgi:hypothetical protein
MTPEMEKYKLIPYSSHHLTSGELIIAMCVFFYLGGVVGYISSYRYANSLVAQSDAALETALREKKEAQLLVNEYKFTLEKVGAMLQNRCNKESGK